MRLAPVAIRWRHNPEKAEAVARRQSLTTHAAAEAVDACALLARILVDAINGKGHEAVRVQDVDPNWQPSIKAIAEGSWRNKAEADIRSTGYVVDTLEAALWAVARTTCFKDAILIAVDLGHDADTVGAVAGQVAGAAYGLDGIPDQWTRQLHRGADIHELA
jgi:ADP-ribosyl-[dinitrogen reductase] hydrolase